MNRKWVVAIVSLVVVGAIAGVIVSRRNATPVTSYREAPVKRGKIEVSVVSTGVVQPENRLEIKPPIAGRVEQVLTREGQKVRKGQILAWMSSNERAALLDAARAKGPEEVARWEELYRATPILAPISGTIILRNVEPGQSFNNVDPVFVMSDRLTIKAQVDETDIAQIHLKQRAKLVLDAYPDQVIPADVDQIAFDAKTVNNVTTYVVDVLPEETPAVMRSGMTANVTFLVESKEDVLTIPTDAIKVENGKRTVLVALGEKGKSESREIEVGASDGRRTEVLSGVKEGDIVLAADLKGRNNKDKASNPFMPMGGGNRRGSGH